MDTPDTGCVDINKDMSRYDDFIPECNEYHKPKIGLLFKTLEDGERFYENYANACGFQTRKSTLTMKDGIPRIRYLLCNRQGTNDKPPMQLIEKYQSNIRKRKTTTSRVDCHARIVFYYESGIGYRVKSFREGHSHAMVPEAFRHLMTCNRNVETVHKMFLHAGIRANIGPVRTFRFYKELSGSYEDIGATSTDFRNYGRDLRAFVDGADAQIILDNFKYKQDSCVGFKFSFDVDDSGKLNRLFWADETSIKSYKLFGDSLSFDATYSTNRYKLIFTPFTGRDNHGRCVTFAAALISHEDVSAYKWVMEQFIECMSNHPKLIITDQDPALRKVVPEIFPHTYHRFCLWHITKKIPDKIPHALRVDPNFKTEFDGLIWSESEEPVEFEQKWHSIMEQYGLSNDKWFCEMYELRKHWIPAYFRDVSMSGLFKTTSLSESENVFFKRYLNKNADLVRFQMHYDSAMDAQRSLFKVSTLSDETGVPTIQIDSVIERHASLNYTIKKFYEVQLEIVSAFMNCVVLVINVNGPTKIYCIDDGSGCNFEVSFDSVDDTVTCSCKCFVRRGIPCSHMICVMRNLKFEKISQKYILSRWSKMSCWSLLNGDDYMPLVNKQYGVNTHQFLMEIGKCIAAVDSNVKLQEDLLNDLKAVSDKYVSIASNHSESSSKRTMIESFYGCKYPNTVSIFNPDVASTKGSGSGGRLKSYKEKAINAKSRPPRKCKRFNRMVNHDSRNCPEKNKEDTN